MPKPKTVTPALLRAEAAALPTHARARDGWSVTNRTECLDANLIARRRIAKRWRLELAKWMDDAGVTSLYCCTRERLSRYSGKVFRYTVYFHPDESEFAYRVNGLLTSPQRFRATFDNP